MQSKNRSERNRKSRRQTIRKPKGSGLLKKAATLAVCAMAGATGSAFYMYTQGAGNVIVNTVSNDSIATAASDTGSAASVAKKISSSVVAITTENLQTSQSWFGTQVSGGAGSGVVVSKNGYIVTCAHVLNGASRIGVTTSDNKKYIARVVGSDSSSDIALLKISATNLTPATFADSDKIQQGEKVYAVGNPEGTFANSITSGIVSAASRKISVTVNDDSDSQSDYGDMFGDMRSSTKQTTMNVIQTDASVSPGNSGGGLFDESGHLIGIVNAKSAGDHTEGLGFAIPEKTVMKKIEQLAKSGSQKKAASGVAGQNQVQMPSN